ncbi:MULTISPECIES: hypothetical protein [Paenibacillus]|uniref:hypothetical protein n=1 Tax=Paenibacillus TaxID=44249 RepID=UPI001F363C60|nr:MULTISPECIES: hypothetical protein [Paenibacillus]
MKKKVGLLSMVLLLILLMTTACARKEKELSLGVTESGSYTNDYFGVSLHFPTDWTYQDADQMNELVDEGAEHFNFGAKDNEDKEKIIKMLQAKTLNLLVVSKFPLDADETGPSLIAYAEKVSMFQSIKNGTDYLEALIRSMGKSEYQYEYDDISAKNIGGKDMDLLKATVDYGNGFVTTQEFYSTIIGEYALCFIVSYIDDESKAETDQILDSVTFQ